MPRLDAELAGLRSGRVAGRIRDNDILRAAGVLVFSGNDNIRDAWWPYGDGDMLERAMLIGYRSGFYTDDELTVAFEMVSSNAASAMRVPDYGLRIGAPANFVALAARHVPEAVVARPPERAIYRAGKLIARNGHLLSQR